MNDYRAKFNNTKHFEKAIDVAYDSDKEYIRFLKQQLQAKDKVIEAARKYIEYKENGITLCIGKAYLLLKYEIEKVVK